MLLMEGRRKRKAEGDDSEVYGLGHKLAGGIIYQDKIYIFAKEEQLVGAILVHWIENAYEVLYITFLESLQK